MPSLINRGLISARAFGFGKVAETISSAVVIGQTASPFIKAYAWTATGYGGALAAPSSSLAGVPADISFNTLGTVLFAGLESGTLKQIEAYSWSGGFGTKYAAPATLPNGGMQGSFRLNKAQNALLGGTGITPWICAWQWSNTTGFGTKYANPATIPADYGAHVAMNNGDSAISVASWATPFIEVYRWTNAGGFGTKFNNPTTVIGGTSRNAKHPSFQSSDTALLFTFSAVPTIHAYAWTNATGFGTKYAAPTGISTSTGYNKINFNIAGSVYLLTSASASTIYAYKWSSGWGTTSLTTNSITVSGAAYDCRFNFNETNVLSSSDTTPFIYVNAWNNTSGFGTRFANPSTLPAAGSYCCTFTPF